ncbi:hypothetical protein PHMEG_00036495 [Phytophthora megakarya]|uniref:Uncharacterized protein n=1 Tax=Phytophthora megakarya TaxID=4795 RepID=A0A225ULN2_9STRA|nr:hypothetical protein PHMEG_00036495 [Phytophthora megakarya]
MDFKCAMKWVSESQGIHHLAPREAVCQMLTQVIYAGQLDETPWWRFVPEGFYTSAEGTLRLRQAKREPTPPWDPSYELSRAELDKSARAEAAADNDDSSEESNGAETESKPAASHLSPADLRESKTQKKSDKDSGSKSIVRSRKIPFDGLRRIRSKLAKLNYDDLRGEHLDMVEAACRETHVSYRIFGILVKFDSYRQSQGYPDFEPHKPDIHILKARWDLEAYSPSTVALLEGEYIRAPWPVMFYFRVTVFYFHEVRDLNFETLGGIKDYVDFSVSTPRLGGLFSIG